MTAADQQIVAMYEQLDMQPAEIAEQGDLGYDVDAIKLCLLQNSVTYRQLANQDAKQGDVLGIFNERDRQLARRVAIDLLQNAEVEMVKARMVNTILADEREERASRRITNMSKVNINILQIQDRLRLAKESLNRLPAALEPVVGKTEKEAEEISV